MFSTETGPEDWDGGDGKNLEGKKSRSHMSAGKRGGGYAAEGAEASAEERAVKAYEEKEAEFPEPEHIREMERVVLLKVIDAKWMDHIDDMTASSGNRFTGIWTEKPIGRI